MSNINFIPLQPDHFPLLLKWLSEPHVKKYWDKDILWIEELIKKKYLPYTMGYKILGKIKKPIHAFIIQADENFIGYIQYYNKYDFPPEQGYDIKDLPKSLAAIDFYIGESKYIGKGLSSIILDLFLKDYVFKEFSACFVDPDSRNIPALKTYQKAGFKIVKQIPELSVTQMVAHNCLITSK